MERSLPAWLFLLLILFGSLAGVFFGWLVKDSANHPAHLNGFLKAAYSVASFPDTARYTLSTYFNDPDADVRVPRDSGDLSGFIPIATDPGINVHGLMVRADPSALMRTVGLRVVVGIFMIDNEPRHAALFLTPEMKIYRVLLLNEADIPQQEPQSEYRKFIHGFRLLKDGSVIFTFDGGVSIQRFDRCGQRMWVTGGNFNHSVSLDDDEATLWTIFGQTTADTGVIQIDTATGDIIRRISISDIIAANPMIDILEIRQSEAFWVNDNPRHFKQKWLIEPFHMNDVEPLSSANADQFNEFEVNDLLISVRSLNLIFVVDPQTLAIKWWHSGAWRRQHDPDWQPSGEISVYDNRTDRGHSRIVSINPRTRHVRVLFDGRAQDFYSRIRGKHQITTDSMLITSPQQGRVFEVDSNGKLIFELVNTRPAEGAYNYLLSEAIWLPINATDSWGICHAEDSH